MSAAGSSAQTPVTRRALPDRQPGRSLLSAAARRRPEERENRHELAPAQSARRRAWDSFRAIGLRQHTCGGSILPPPGDAISAGESLGARIRDEIRHETWPRLSPHAGSGAPRRRPRVSESERGGGFGTSPGAISSVSRAQISGNTPPDKGRRGNFQRLGPMLDEITSQAPRGGRDWARPRTASRGRPG